MNKECMRCKEEIKEEEGFVKISKYMDGKNLNDRAFLHIKCWKEWTNSRQALSTLQGMTANLIKNVNKKMGGDEVFEVK